MKQSEALDMITKIQLAHQAMESACKRIDELKEENKNLKEALKQEQGKSFFKFRECEDSQANQTKQEQGDQDEFLLRGVLASELKCWHRLTADESQNLIDFVKNMGAKQEQGEPDYWLGYGLQAHTEKPFDDATPLYKELK